MPERDFDNAIIPHTIIEDYKLRYTQKFMVYGPLSQLPEAFLLGAEDYLKDPWTMDEAFFRIKHHYPRQWHISGLGSPQLEGHILWLNNTPLHLTITETRAMEALLENYGKPIPPQRLYQKCYPNSLHNYDALKTMLYRLRKKLSTRFPQLKLKAHRHTGYSLEQTCG